MYRFYEQNTGAVSWQKQIWKQQAVLILLSYFPKNMYVSAAFRNRRSCVQKEMLFSVCVLRMKHYVFAESICDTTYLLHLYCYQPVDVWTQTVKQRSDACMPTLPLLPASTLNSLWELSRTTTTLSFRGEGEYKGLL